MTSQIILTILSFVWTEIVEIISKMSGAPFIMILELTPFDFETEMERSDRVV